MAVASAVELNILLDDMVSMYLRILGTSASAYGVGESSDTYGAADKADDLKTMLTSYLSTAELIASVGPAIIDIHDNRVSGKKIAKQVLSRLFSSVQGHILNQAGSSYPSIDDYLKFLNVDDSTKWQALQAYQFRDLYNAWKGVNPGVYNLYFEVLQGATYANALGKFIVGTGYTDGVAVDSTKYAGGIPALNVSSFAGSSDTVTVTGTFYDPATEAVETSKTATFTVNGNGRFYRVGGTAAANALIIGVDSVSVGASITASTTIYVEAERPALRTGTAQAGAATTITLDASASALDDFYNGLQVGHTGDKYTLRTISDYDGSTKVATVSASWATNPTGSDTFRILRMAVPG